MYSSTAASHLGGRETGVRGLVPGAGAGRAVPRTSNAPSAVGPAGQLARRPCSTNPGHQPGMRGSSDTTKPQAVRGLCRSRPTGKQHD